MDHRPVTATLLALICLLLTACTTMLSNPPQAPTVDIDSVKVAKISFTRQDVIFRLNVNNPNSFDLLLQTLSFIAALDGVEMAQGMSTERVTIPGKETAQLDVHVSTRINKLLGQLLLATNESRKDIAYDVRGFVKLSNWPTRIPFNTGGALDNPALK